MSTAYSSAKQKYIGNGVTTEWGFDFPIQKHSELKVYLKRSGSTQVLLEEGVDYSFVTENTIAFPIKTGEAKLQAADVLALQRESVFESEYNFSNQQRLEPEEVMHADDNLERQIQELKRDSESAIKVLPTSNVDTNTFFEHVERVYGSVDNIDTVANDKANLDKVAGSITNVNTVSGDIKSVKNVANNIKSVVVDATNISDIKTVAGSIANVNKTAGSINNVNVVAPSISSVNTVAANISSVNTAASNMAAIKAAPTAASNAAKSAANAANSATISANSAIWAEGTDAQVAALGGVHSSKGWAQQSTSVNISLTNSPYTTNRILEIPQDIKLELNDGTLTLKAGSKVYVPNGSGNFDVITTTQDYAADTSAYSGMYVLSFTNGNPTGLTIIKNPVSGDTAPTSPELLQGWYDTTNNLVKRYNNGWQTQIHSFPLAICTSDGTKITSINQVFNGFGYIGSTVFALPGVKVQAATGRNVDGTCISPVRTVSSVLTYEAGPWNNATLYFLLWTNACEGQDVRRFTRNKEFSSQSATYSFDENENKWYYSNNNQTWTSSGFSLNIVGKFVVASGKITSFEPYTVDSVVNSNEFYQLKDKAVTTDTAQTITGTKTFKGVVTSELESINFIAKNPTMNVNETPSANKYVGYDFRGKDNVRIGYIGIIQGTDGTFTYTIQKIGNYVTKIVGITPPVDSGGIEMVTAAWVNTKLGGFANTNASNFTATGKQTIVGWGTPDYSAEVTISNNYKAPSDGFIFCGVKGNGSENTTINGHLVAVTYNTGVSGSLPQLCLPVSKGDVFNTGSDLNWARFYPLKGV